MDPDRLLSRLESREEQLRNMAIQLSESLTQLAAKDSQIISLQCTYDLLRKRAKLKESQLSQELIDKAILLREIQKAEKGLLNPHAKQKASSIEFHSMPLDPPERHASVISEDVDITEELAKLGLGGIANKYSTS